MIVKLVGAALVTLSCAVASRAVISGERKKLIQLDSFIALIKYIRGQIDCYSAPIDRILSGCPAELLDELGGRSEGMTFKDLLEREELVIYGESFRVLDEFSSTFGKNYRDRQVKLCDGAVSELERIRSEAQKCFVSKKKTVKVMCAALGGLAILFFM